MVERNKDKLYVYVRDIETRDIVKTVEFTDSLSQRNLNRVEAALLTQLDLDTQFIDSVAVSMAIQRKRR